MNLCIPITVDLGLDSPVSSHFGSAPLFLVVDTDRQVCRALPNRDSHHGHGMCRPLASLRDEPIDGVVVGGIGAGALSKLQGAGLRVYRTDRTTVAETVTAFVAGALPEVSPGEACAHHGHEGHGHDPHGHAGQILPGDCRGRGRPGR